MYFYDEEIVKKMVKWIRLFLMIPSTQKFVIKMTGFEWVDPTTVTDITFEDLFQLAENGEPLEFSVKDGIIVITDGEE